MQRDPAIFERHTHLRVMIRPLSLLVLLTVCAIAVGFGFLAQWQLSHAIRVDETQNIDTETPVDFLQLSSAGSAITDYEAGRRVSMRGAFTEEFLLARARDVDRAEGAAGAGAYWLVGRLRLNSDRAELVVVLGSVSSREEAQTALAALTAPGSSAREEHEFTGRLFPTEEPLPPQTDGTLLTVAPAQIVNRWASQPVGWVSPGFVILDDLSPLTSAASTKPAHSPAPTAEAPASSQTRESTPVSPSAEAALPASAQTLAPTSASAQTPTSTLSQELPLRLISTRAPAPAETLNLLNLFYAIEWVVFAAFAFYFWYRYTKDVYLRELEELLENTPEPHTKHAMKHASTPLKTE